MDSVGRIRTDKAADYRIRLAKHFAHRIPVEETGGASVCRFPFGTARLAADAEGLTVALTADDAEALDRIRSVIVDHLDRFAFREAPLAATWTAPAAASDGANADRPL